MSRWDSGCRGGDARSYRYCSEPGQGEERTDAMWRLPLFDAPAASYVTTGRPGPARPPDIATRGPRHEDATARAACAGGRPGGTAPARPRGQEGRGETKGGHTPLRDAHLPLGAGQDEGPARSLPRPHLQAVHQARHDHHRLLEPNRRGRGREENGLPPRLSEQGGDGEELESLPRRPGLAEGPRRV